jgi:hypothetical protein
MNRNFWSLCTAPYAGETPDIYEKRKEEGNANYDKKRCGRERERERRKRGF